MNFPLCRQLAFPFPFCKNIYDQGQYKLNMKRSLDGHKWKTIHIITIQLISLKAIFASMSRNTQYYVVELVSQISWTPLSAPSITALSLAQICSSWHALVASGPVNLIIHLEKKCLTVSKFIFIWLYKRQDVFQAWSGGHT